MAAGALIVVGHLLTVDSGVGRNAYLDQLAAHPTTGVLGGLLTSAGCFLLLPGLAALLGLVRRRGAALGTVAAVMIGTGVASLGAGDTMITLVMGTLVDGHRALAGGLYDVANTAPLLGLPFVLAPLVVLGAILLGIALFRARTVPVWLAALLAVGGALIPISSAGGPYAAVVLLPFGVALALLGLRAMRV